MKYVLVALLRLYRFAISPLYGDVCRYYPTCSAYALESVQVHGAIKGSWLSVRRLGRCHPWAAGGFDYVPPRKHSRHTGPPKASQQATLQRESSHVTSTQGEQSWVS